MIAMITKPFKTSLAGTHMEVIWPWKEGSPKLPDSYQLARARLISLSLIKYELKKEIIEKVNDRTEYGYKKKHYIPHHALISTPECRNTTAE